MADLNSTVFYFNREQEEVHAEKKAKDLNLPYVNLANYPLVKEVLTLISEEDSVRYEVVPYLKIGKEVRMGVVLPENKQTQEFLHQLEQKLNITATVALISKSSLFYGFASYEKLRKAAEDAGKKTVAAANQETIHITDIKSAAEAAKKVNTTELLDTLLIGAINLNASDIHIEPGENDFLTRYRIDGVLQDLVDLPLPQYKQLLSRIKFMSKLRMDLSDKPQDGRFSFTAPGDVNIDFRVSIMPSAYGESVVLRLLGHEKSILQLDKLGFRPDALIAIRDAISRPHGMILTSGPTGSGKSSTLYAILMEKNKPGVKIITLEDPVEYKIEGIEQSQVRTEAGYGFPEGLRASLRQDPDILMVGEIRDADTAEIAVQAALTGHLLLSTIHANSAPAVYVRLLEIGVKPFLLSGSINLIMAQRLVRKVCPSCRQEYTVTPEQWQAVVETLKPVIPKLNKAMADKLQERNPRLIHGVGCEKCNNSGYLGRQVIVEILIPNEQIEALVSKNASISEFEKTALSLGMITMEQDGLAKALAGITTIEEVWRVTRS